MALSSIQVVIESEPYWIEKPEDQNVGIGEDVTFVCDADGRPAPNKVDWYVNGDPIQSEFLRARPRLSLNNKVLEITNVDVHDTSVFSCNVTNKHGYAWTNFYLNVLGILKIFDF
jgi:neuronal cell adhesion protein